MGWALRLAACLACFVPCFAYAAIPVVAAENFYGDIVRQIGGDQVQVTSILSNPDTDPHLFQANPSIARAFATARIIVLNGAGYDPWAERLAAASQSPERTVIVVASLLGHAAGDNPHIWYDPGTMPVLAVRLADVLAAADPAHAALFRGNLRRFDASVRALTETIAALRGKVAGQLVTATEPVAGYLLAALGLTVRNEGFQIAVMNGTEPSPGDVAQFEADLRSHRVKALIYNSQATEKLVRRMLGIARGSGVPVAGVTETEPPGKTWQEWMMEEVEALGRALEKPQ